MRIVVTSGYSDYECSATLVECLEFESVEALETLIRESTERYLAELSAVGEAYKKWYEKSKRIMSKSRGGKAADRKAALNAELGEHQKTRPVNPDPRLVINGREFNRNDFLGHDPTANRHYLDMPTILSLEDWFEKKLNNEI